MFCYLAENLYCIFRKHDVKPNPMNRLASCECSFTRWIGECLFEYTNNSFGDKCASFLIRLWWKFSTSRSMRFCRVWQTEELVIHTCTLHTSDFILCSDIIPPIDISAWGCLRNIFQLANPIISCLSAILLSGGLETDSGSSATLNYTSLILKLGISEFSAVSIRNYTRSFLTEPSW